MFTFKYIHSDPSLSKNHVRALFQVKRLKWRIKWRRIFELCTSSVRKVLNANWVWNVSYPICIQHFTDVVEQSSKILHHFTFYLERKGVTWFYSSLTLNVVVPVITPQHQRIWQVHTLQLSCGRLWGKDRQPLDDRSPPHKFHNHSEPKASSMISRIYILDIAVVISEYTHITAVQPLKVT